MPSVQYRFYPVGSRMIALITRHIDREKLLDKARQQLNLYLVMELLVCENAVHSTWKPGNVQIRTANTEEKSVFGKRPDYRSLAF